MRALITAENLHVRAEGRLLVDVPHLEVAQGERLVLLGPTGAGKSTLLQTLGLLRRPNAGRIHWQGNPVPWPPPMAIRRRMTMVFQDPLLFQGTVRDNVTYGLRLRRLPAPEIAHRAEAVMSLLHIDHLAERTASTLSGGEAQRTALARALAVFPDLLLLDEPFANLDAPIRERLVPDLKDALRALNLTCVFVTHHQREALVLADRIAVLHEGRLEQIDEPAAVFQRPRTHFVASFVGIRNLWPGRILRREGSLAEVLLEEDGLRLWAESPLPVGTDVLLALRSERVRFHAQLPDGAQGWEARVVSVEDQLHTRVLHLEGPRPLRAHVPLVDTPPGGLVAVELRPEDLHLVPRSSPGTPCP